MNLTIFAETTTGKSLLISYVSKLQLMSLDCLYPYSTLQIKVSFETGRCAIIATIEF